MWNLFKKLRCSGPKRILRQTITEFFDLTTKDKNYCLQQLMSVKRYFTSLITALILRQEIPSKFIAELLTKAASEKK